MTTSQKYTPALKIPRIIGVLVGLWLGVHLLLIFSDTPTLNNLIYGFALLPSRFSGESQNIGIGLITLITYSFMHGGWGHLFLNAIWFIAFATPLARRFSITRFSLFYLSCVILAGLTQVIFGSTNAHDIPIIGASGGVAACMGATTRFAFPERRFFDPRIAHHARLIKLRALANNRAIVIFIVLWIGFNLIFGLLGATGGTPSGEPVLIAWQAHLGGFFAGILLMSLFDPPPLSPSGGPGQVEYQNWR